MAFIKLRVPDSAELLVVPLPVDAALLIGRDPNLGRVERTLWAQLGDIPVQFVKVPSLRVSANHLMIRRVGAAVTVADLRSRNGTWMRLPSLHTITMEDDVELTLDLAGLTNASVSSVGPRQAEWLTEAEYPAAVCKAISDWLRHSGVDAQIYTKSSGATRSPDSDEDGLALSGGSKLHVLPPSGATFELPWGSLVERLRDYVNEQNIRFEQLQGHDEDFILASPRMWDVHQRIVDAAAYGMRLMILGPSGAGKERLARCFHRHSRQHRGPYAAVNCALLKENLLYAQLFGARRGSYTGAVQDVTGLVEAAHDGTLFLDELGELDLEVQKALLRFLDYRGEYQRLGDTQVRRANVQIVCATNKPLDNPLERRGKFRDDLWYRLAVKVVEVPPLRERREDILAFLKLRHLRGGQIHAIEALTPGALQLVLQDPWPGNFRDLENFVERLPAMAAPGTIDEKTCEATIQEGRGKSARSGVISGSFRPPTQLPVPGGNWPGLSTVADKAFEEDYGSAPMNWSQLQVYSEKYFKPVFIAYSCGLVEINELSKNINYSELARRLNIADGTTIRMHLSRYIERFRKSTSTPL